MNQGQKYEDMVVKVWINERARYDNHYVEYRPGMKWMYRESETIGLWVWTSHECENTQIKVWNLDHTHESIAVRVWNQLRMNMDMVWNDCAASKKLDMK